MMESSLEARVAALERKHHGCNKTVDNLDETMRRARFAVESAGLYSAVWKFVPQDYYNWPLKQRAACLGASSIHHLCKSLLLDNKKVPKDAPHDPTNPKFVLVVLQYAAELDNQQLVNAIRALRKDVHKRLPDSQFDFRLASPADNDRLTGYTHNSVTPFGLYNGSIPIVLAESIVPLKFFWMGGGHVHLKLGMSVADFRKALKPVVAPISQPRANVDGGLD